MLQTNIRYACLLSIHNLKLYRNSFSFRNHSLKEVVRTHVNFDISQNLIEQGIED